MRSHTNAVAPNDDHEDLRQIVDRYQLNALEHRVLLLVNRGCSNREIAAELDIDPSTVKQTVTAILRKLHVLRHRQQWPNDL